MLKPIEVLKGKLTMSINILAITTILVGIVPLMINSEFSISNTFASSNSTNNSLNDTGDTEKMVTKLLYPKFGDNDSSRNLNPPLLDQNDYNTNFKLLPSITGIVTEVPFIGNGTIKGISYNHTGFFSGVWNLPHNLLQYNGAVNLTTIDGEAYYSLQGLSRVDSNGNVQGNGIAFFNTNSTGKISSLDGITIFYEDKIENPTAFDSPHRIIGWKME